MSDDLEALVIRLQCGVATHDDISDAAELIGDQQDRLAYRAAEIARLRAAINDALTAPWPDPELNSTRHQEPIGPNETPEEAVKRLVSVRAEWAVYKNNCENPVIAELRAALATARREGMEEAAQIADRCAADWSKSATGMSAYSKWDFQSRSEAGEDIAAAIRAALTGGKDE